MRWILLIKIVAGSPAINLVAGANYGTIFLNQNTTESIFELHSTMALMKWEYDRWFLSAGRSDFAHFYPGGSWLVLRHRN